MKRKIIPLFFLILFSTNGYSQLTKGFWMFGGNGSFENSRTYYSQGQLKVTTITASPNVGFFVFDKFATGVRLDFRYTKGGSINPPYSKSTIWQIGPYARYYFLSKSKRVNLLSEGSVIYELNKYNETTLNSAEFRFLGGPVIFLNSSVGVEFLAGYKAGKFESTQYNSFFF
jgi:hypothetical protein